MAIATEFQSLQNLSNSYLSTCPLFTNTGARILRKNGVVPIFAPFFPWLMPRGRVTLLISSCATVMWSPATVWCIVEIRNWRHLYYKVNVAYATCKAVDMTSKVLRKYIIFPAKYVWTFAQYEYLRFRVERTNWVADGHKCSLHRFRRTPFRYSPQLMISLKRMVSCLYPPRIRLANQMGAIAPKGKW